ncbi:AMP-binding protein [Parvularcula dongshanensis]|uniref:Acyl-CoA synthetase (AMP-forming)/AMP-acid ligase II/serine acetyltransferase n=1 Tax=Parvularcula dongshanensis TaxID=1173995 RepID=A0A840I1C4_9PROT|nr:AMP-binding protein [Parvularcula dongshanensis]MBB4657998.1 acyl-CoA synthetase (AMP-forming)/AMP-acid ligase II/serine acetyltransferase [Parvularcula dongshanensis]
MSRNEAQAALTPNEALGRPVVGVVAANGPEYVRTLLGLFRDGKVAVPLRAADDAERLSATGAEDVAAPAPGGGWIEERYAGTGEDGPALVSFTSGTEGEPKAIVLSHAALEDVVARLTEAMGATEALREYVGVPVTHSFGFGRCRLAAAVGGKAFVPEGGFDPYELAAMIEAGEVNAVSAVPSLWRLVLARPDLFRTGSRNVRWIEIGSQYMAADEKRALKALFPSAAILQHYGLTEASRSTFLRIDQAPDDRLESVGRAVGGVEARIGEGGRIEIKGPHLASGRLTPAGIVPITQGDGWLRTSDLGRIEDGYVYYEGRADDLINCGGKKLSPDRIEREVARRLGVAGGFALARLPDARYGERALLAIEDGADLDEETLRAGMAESLSAEGVDARSVLTVTRLAALPRTATGKVQRRLVAQAYLEDEAAASAPVAADLPLEDRLASLLGEARLDPSRSLRAYEADSITSLEAAMLLEGEGGRLPAGWLDLPLSTLLARTDDGGAEQRPVFEKNEGRTNGNPKDIGLLALIREDFRTHESDLLSHGFWALFWHRFANWRMGVRFKPARMVLTLIYRFSVHLVRGWSGIKLDYTVRVGRRVKLEHFGGMILGAQSIGNDVTIRQNTTFGVGRLSALDEKPIIEDGVNIATGAVIAGGVVVGRHCVIGPNAVVTADVPPYSIVQAAPVVVTASAPRTKRK